MKRLVVLLMFLIAVPVCAIEVGVLDRPAGLYAVLADTDPLLAILTYSPLSSPVIYLARMGGFGGQGTVVVEGLVAGVATASSGSAGALGGYGLITSNGLVLAARSLSGQGGSAATGTFTASGAHVVLLSLSGQGGTGTMGTLAITAGSSSSVARALVGLGASGGVFGSSDLLTSFDIPMDGLGGVADVGALTAVGGSASLGAVLGGSGAAGGYGVLTVSTTGNDIAAALGRGASAGYGVITASGLVFATASPDGQGGAGSTGTVGAAIGVVNGFAALGGTGTTSSYGAVTASGLSLGAASLSGKGGAGSGGTISVVARHLAAAVLTGGGAAGGYGVMSVPQQADISTFETDNSGWTATADFDTTSGRSSFGSTAHGGTYFYDLVGGNDNDTTYYDGIMSRTFPTLKNGTLTLWAVTNNSAGATLQVSVSGGTVTPSGTTSINYDGSVTPVWTQYTWVISGITNGTSHTVTIKNTYTVDGAVTIDDISVPIQ